MTRGTRWLSGGACVLTVVVALGGGVAASAEPAATVGISVGAVKAIPEHVDPSAVACPPGTAVASSTCFVLGSTSSSSLLNPVVDGTPKAPAITVTGGTSVACMSGTCLEVGVSTAGKGVLQWVTGGHLKKTVVLKNSSYLHGVACGTTTCVVVGEVYGTPTKNGTPTYGVAASVSEAQSAPSATRVGGVADLDAVACASPTACYAVGSTTGTTTGEAVVVPVTDGKIGARTLAKGSDAFDAISCGTTTSCWATGTTFSAKAGVTSTVVAISKGKPGATRAGPENGSAIACIDASTCFFASATSQYGKGEVDELSSGKVVKTVVLPKFDYGTLTGIVCPTSTSCLVTGATGFHNPGPNYFYTGAVVTLKLSA